MTLLKKCLLRLLVFFAYGLIGSWLFTLIERRNETNATTANRALERLKKSIGEKYNLTNITEQDFNEFVEAAYNAIRIRKQKDWTFKNGLGFTFPALTTIGFGEITPKTALGQGFTIPYCLVGLPLTMLALKTSGEVILLALRTTTTNFEKNVLGRRNPKIGFMEMFWILIFLQSLLICMFAVIEIYAFNWTFLEGVYCWFITFTTIGFGDYVPFTNQLGETMKPEWLIPLIGFIVTIPSIAGLCLISSLLNLLVESSEKIKMRRRTLRTCSACTENTNNDSDDTSTDHNGLAEEKSISTLKDCNIVTSVTSL